MWIYIFIFILVIYAFIKELQALGCSKKIIEGEDCDNSKGKAVKGSSSDENDTTDQILNNINYAINYNTRFVKWRSFYLTAVFGMFMLWFVIFQKIPSEWELIVGIMIIFLMLALLQGFYQFHLFRHIQINIEKSTDILRSRNIQEKSLKEEYKTFVPYHNVSLDSGLKYSPFLV